jgi:hypothetical protein
MENYFNSIRTLYQTFDTSFGDNSRATASAAFPETTHLAPGNGITNGA